jgi:argininosuccinate lyase
MDRSHQIIAAISQSASFDWRLALDDVACTRAHVTMLADHGLVPADVGKALLSALDLVSARIAEGNFVCRTELEDVHSNVEAAVRDIAGEAADWLSVARARNDLAVTALRLWLLRQVDAHGASLCHLAASLSDQASQHATVLLAGMTHQQIAQPVTWGHMLLAYAEMFLRDASRFARVREALGECPLGACALAGTSFPIDRHATAHTLGFARPTENSIDSVADRDFALDYLAACATASIHLSRIAEDFVVWLTPGFGFFRLPEFLAGRSSIIPHKRNPDALELVRAKAARCITNLATLQTVLKGLSMSYARDLQEDKEVIFDSAETLALCLDTMALVFSHLEIDEAAMRRAAEASFSTSSDYADWLVRERGFPHADAHRLTGVLVGLAQQTGGGLSQLTASARASVDPRLGGDDWPDIDAAASVASRKSFGGTAPVNVIAAAERLRTRIETLARSFARTKDVP